VENRAEGCGRACVRGYYLQIRAGHQDHEGSNEEMRSMSEDKLVCYKLKVSKADLQELRGVARLEALRQERDTTWGDLVRDAIRWMVEHKRPVE
jgi:hypothetical protein